MFIAVLVLKPFYIYIYEKIADEKMSTELRMVESLNSYKSGIILLK